MSRWTFNAARVAACLAGVWAGALLAVALAAAPAAFAVLPAEQAGRVASRLFMQEARWSLVAGAAMLILLRRRTWPLQTRAGGSVFSAELALVLGALFFTVIGHYVLQPMAAAARAGQGAMPFATVHGMSAGVYGLKTLLVLALTWRLSAR